MIQRPADSLHVPEFSISLSLSSYEQFIKTQKPQLHYCPDGLLVKLSAFHAKRPGLNPAWANSYFFSQLFFHCKLSLRTFVYMFLNYTECFYVI